MKKILFLLLLFVSITAYPQLEKVNVSTPNSGAGDPLRTAFIKLNLGIDTINAHSSVIPLKAVKHNTKLTGITDINSLRVGGLGKVLLDSITTDGTNIYFYRGATLLTAVPGTGGAAWGSITGTLTD